MRAFRRAEPPTRGYTFACLAFRWKDELYNCYICGLTKSSHTYYAARNSEHAVFHIRQWNQHCKQWQWVPVGSIIAKEVMHD